MTKKPTKKQPRKAEMKKKPKIDKLPYIPPTQKIIDMEKDSHDIILPPDLDQEPEKYSWLRKISRFATKFKHKLMKKFNVPELYADIIFFVIELLIVIGLIYLIMIILIFTKKYS